MDSVTGSVVALKNILQDLVKIVTCLLRITKLRPNNKLRLFHNQHLSRSYSQTYVFYVLNPSVFSVL